MVVRDGVCVCVYVGGGVFFFNVPLPSETESAPVQNYTDNRQ